jgi:membrane peptidoglycan carboxypeptidase
LVKWIVLLGVGGVLGVFVLLAAAFAWYSRDLPSPDRVVRREGFSTKILARGGESLYDVHGDVAREPVNFADVPVYLREATVAVEDKNFYQHQGFDPLGMARALIAGRLNIDAAVGKERPLDVGAQPPAKIKGICPFSPD